MLVKFGFVGGDIGGGTKAAVCDGLGAKVGGSEGAVGGGWKEEAAGGGVGVHVGGAEGALGVKLTGS